MVVQLAAGWAHKYYSQQSCWPLELPGLNRRGWGGMAVLLRLVLWDLAGPPQDLAEGVWGPGRCCGGCGGVLHRLLGL